MFRKVLILGVAVLGFATAVLVPLGAEPHGATAGSAVCSPGNTNTNYCVSTSTTSSCAPGNTNANYCVTTTTTTTPRCPFATGTVTGSTLGPFTLGMTREQAVKAGGPSSSQEGAYVLYFCALPAGYQIGFPSPLMLSVLPRSQRANYAGRVVWISTSNTHFKIDGVTRGSSETTALNRLKNGDLFGVGQNEWYLAPFQGQTAVFKIDRGTVQEIGIGFAALTETRYARRIFVSSFL